MLAGSVKVISVLVGVCGQTRRSSSSSHHDSSHSHPWLLLAHNLPVISSPTQLKTHQHGYLSDFLLLHHLWSRLYCIIMAWIGSQFLQLHVQAVLQFVWFIFIFLHEYHIVITELKAQIRKMLQPLPCMISYAWTDSWFFSAFLNGFIILNWFHTSCVERLTCTVYFLIYCSFLQFNPNFILWIDPFTTPFLSLPPPPYNWSFLAWFHMIWIDSYFLQSCMISYPLNCPIIPAVLYDFIPSELTHISCSPAWFHTLWIDPYFLQCCLMSYTWIDPCSAILHDSAMSSLWRLQVPILVLIM